MIRNSEPWVAADGLRGLADNTTSAVIASLSLVAVVVLGYGLVRAIIMNRRHQIVVADLVAPSGAAELAEAATLSAVLRQCVQSQIKDQRAQITRIEKDIITPASWELELKVDDAAVDQIQSAANDSTATLLAALRAVTPGTADRFLGLFSAILPPPRGASVSVGLIQRGANAAQRVGASVEVVRLDGRPFASEVFWEPWPEFPDNDDSREGSTERILSLLDPVTRWVAVRLLTLMVSSRRRITRQARRGLQQLLAGGLFLQAMRDFPDHALTFGEEACDELELAHQLLPQIPLPVETLAAVYERMGWARHKAGDRAHSSDNFRTAAALWQDAERLTRQGTDAAEGKLTRVLDRKLKAQLVSGDPALCRSALAELKSISVPPALLTNRVWLYNRACLYAQAGKADASADYEKTALLWLGRALIYYRDSSMWDDAQHHDPELAPLRSILGPFLVCLRSLVSGEPDQLKQEDAEALLMRAIERVFEQQPDNAIDPNLGLFDAGHSRTASGGQTRITISSLCSSCLCPSCAPAPPASPARRPGPSSSPTGPSAPSSATPPPAPAPAAYPSQRPARRPPDPRPRNHRDPGRQ
jgi:hypothetical protein